MSYYLSILEHMLEGFQIIDHDWRYKFVNNAVAEQGGKTKEELLGHVMWEVFPGIEKTELFQVLKRCMEERSEQRMENEFVYPDETTRWFDLSIQPVPEGILILSIDITARKSAEESLRQSHDLFRMIAENIDDMIAVLDPEGKRIYNSPSYKPILGNPESLQGTDSFAEIHPWTSPLAWDRISEY